MIRWHGYAALGVRSLRRTARAGDVDQVPRAGLARRRRLAVLGTAPLRPHSGGVLRLAGERLPRLPLLRRAPAGGPPCHGRPARLGAVRRLERAARAARLGLGPVRGEPAARMGRVPAPGRWCGDPRDDPGVHPVRRPPASCQGVEPVRLGLVYPRRADVHPTGLPGRQRGARVPARCPGGDVQRPLDSRCRGLVRHPDGPGRRVRRHPGRLPAADFQPLPFDDRVLGAVPALPAQWHPPLRLLVDPDGGPEGGGRRLGLPRRRRDPRCHEPAPVAAGPVGHGCKRHAAPVRLGRGRRLPDRRACRARPRRSCR